ncbi:hypothetical protein F3K20_12780 [Streptomyces scabiei]|uniref:hypothetical protein n=1 Tax=Streptomyces scabiei TaxID=1930 RepID=UPI001B30BE04|nr:hypothetical protein [Streptomyces sp. LBUM 1482]QTU45624.1 hypothetical protein F3K20_12780 [Streptomyces sp. LBUM 1482]
MTTSNETETSRRAAVYRLYDAGGALLYIGSAYDPDERCKKHEKKPWWPKVASRTEEWFDHRLTAYKEELAAIAVEKSKYNVMGTPSYRTPQTEAIRRRTELAPLRQRLLTESDQLTLSTYSERRAAGESVSEARRAGALAAIAFLEETGLFKDAVKRRRERLELHGR